MFLLENGHIKKNFMKAFEKEIEITNSNDIKTYTRGWIILITHYIIMSSSYTQGKRIALDYLLDEKVDYTKLKDIISIITDKCGKDVSISTHFV